MFVLLAEDEQDLCGWSKKGEEEVMANEPERWRGSDHLGLAGRSLASPLGEMEAIEGLEERIDMTWLDALVQY